MQLRYCKRKPPRKAALTNIDNLLIRLASRQVAIALADDVAILSSHNDALPHDADLDLFAVADAANLFRVIAKRVLATQLFGNAPERDIQILARIGLERPAAAILGEQLKILTASRVLGR